ncbi:AraC family transcriptional regulator [Paucibacter sp. PLA-PC-4]|uniref:AraC family transcriptional regulator n=1 Tax=Paucibacter sp. PLA-PC-4 TaxID=2993655 RepID=UPI00224B30F6|nr:AraC family transcriptional regulator [Paucibacter sp. PLA-PC-4]MCX2863572.1 AraC family transcriptional regulator [Paucibacter sp. PLA-PC-4]
MPDRLASLLQHFSIHAQTFQAGPLCGINSLDAGTRLGQLHLIRSGEVEVLHDTGPALRISQPSLLLYPQPMSHRFRTDPQQGADFVCAHLDFEGQNANPIAAALAPWVCLPLSELSGCEPVLQLLFAEAEAQNCGRQAVMDRLFELVLIQVLRVLMAQGRTQMGMLSGLGHERLRGALVAMHEQPQRDWSLAALAEQAGMSRTVFSGTFRDTVGCTPGAYLQAWRIGLAQKMLSQGQSLKWIASEVGYGSEAALSRAFRAQTGQSPRDWRKRQTL